MESENSSSSLSDVGGDSRIHRYGYGGGEYNNVVRVSDGTSHTEIVSTSVAIVKNGVGSNLDGSINSPTSAAETAPPLTLTDEEEKNLSIQRRLANQKEWVEKLRETKEKIGMSGLVKLLNGSDCPSNYNTPARQRLCATLLRMLLSDPISAAPPEKTTVSVYRIDDLSHPRTRHMVHFNAVDYQLAGCAVITAGIRVVVVGGEENSIERYGKLLLRGIKWSVAPVLKSEAQDEDGDENKKKRKKQVNKCVLLWQGIVAKPSFNRFTVHMCKTQADARKVFLDAGVTDYWDLALNYSSEEE